MVSFNSLINALYDSYHHSYNALIEENQDGTFSATLIGLSDCKSIGQTENEAVEKLQDMLQARLSNSKLVTLQIESLQTENPWMKVAGMYKDNPLFDEVLAEIEAERQIISAEHEKD
ncbi:type II toxin-antitoxin system HicB family antitoxin [Calothrix membranacea FACHB-236]|nr:type II toxin-antitoxin system HicB family antitoxin [Calothrix membranacea FACHB-236]